MSEVICRDENFNDLYDLHVLQIHRHWEEISASGYPGTFDSLSSHYGSDPSVRAYNNRGFYYYKKGKYDQAISDLREAFRLYNEQSDLREAFRLYNEQIKFARDSNSDFAMMQLNLGSAYYAKRDYNMAIEHYDNVVRLCPNYETDFIESKFVHGGQDAVEVAIKLLNSKVNTSFQSADDFYYTGVEALFRNDGLSAEYAFQIALLLGYGDRNKIEQHLTNLKNRE